MRNYAMILGGLICMGLLAFQFLNPASSEKEEGDLSTISQPPQAAEPPKVVIEEEPIKLQLDAESIGRVRNAVRDSDPVVRWSSVRFLVSIGDDDAASLLFAMLHRDGAPENRIKVVGLLAEYNEPEVTANLVRALKDIDTSVRLAVLDGLAEIGDYSVSESISKMVHDSNETVRLKAIETLDKLEKRRDEEIKTSEKKQAREMQKWQAEHGQNPAARPQGE